MKICNTHDFRHAIRSGPYAWPGGYPLYFVMADGEAVSFDAAKAERRQILEAMIRNERGDMWRPIAFEVNWEDADLMCAHTGMQIESAYN